MKKTVYQFVFFAALVTAPAKADVFGDFVGILTDPLKLGKASENAIHAIERLNIHVETLVGRVDSSVYERLNQVASISRNIKIDIDDSIQRSFVQIEALQAKIYSDTADLLRCSVEENAENVRSHLSRALNDLGKRKIRLEIFGFPILWAKIDPQDIDSPIEFFREYKKLKDGKLAEVREEDHPAQITDIYADVAWMARLTRCDYASGSSKWLELYRDYELENIRLQKYWINVKPL